MQLATIQYETNIKDLMEFFSIGMFDAMALVDKGHTLVSIQMAYPELPADWVYGILNEN